MRRVSEVLGEINRENLCLPDAKEWAEAIHDLHKHLDRMDRHKVGGGCSIGMVRVGIEAFEAMQLSSSAGERNHLANVVSKVWEAMEAQRRADVVARAESDEFG